MNKTAAADRKTVNDLETAYSQLRDKAGTLIVQFAKDYGKEPHKGHATLRVNPTTMYRLHIGRPDKGGDPDQIQMWLIPVVSDQSIEPGKIELHLAY